MFGLYETAFAVLEPGNYLMFLIAGILVYLSIAKKKVGDEVKEGHTLCLLESMKEAQREK